MTPELTSVGDEWHTVSASDVRACLAIPGDTDNKYRRGVVLLATGSRTYPGAAVLTAEAACRSGAGMVRYSGPERVADAVLAVRPEVVHGLGKFDALVIGSGIPDAREDERSALYRSALAAGIPTVADAGALTLVEPGQANLIITPHAKELSALLERLGLAKLSADEIAESGGEAAVDAAKLLGCTVLLKGRHTYIVEGEERLHVRSPNSWLATAGTGDVLAGVIGTVLAGGHARGDARSHAQMTGAAAWLHARGGWFASQRSAGIPVLPTSVHAPSLMLDHGPLGGPILATDVAAAMPSVIAAVLSK
ncbi:NAD(P)H-hydrate dehydratase [Gulosibacter macacae]|uniref:ADP-dependent (S)-NAD(P)H-hydrate dehydratase n=1 Tax=Gulosibacter macacae TaxID=2488791 RepID=A0A3P3W1L5_9MICO|nr:ADP/ATP-dependent (S)-NAD(P)H-hydrate dehydratase [Gulosibacter macacae]RRJ88674.1 NAD(P)H-hydrate dehydratase [Gulosibacter macacae]